MVLLGVPTLVFLAMTLWDLPSDGCVLQCVVRLRDLSVQTHKQTLDLEKPATDPTKIPLT